MKVVKLSAESTGRLYPSRDNSGTYFCWRPNRPHGYSAAGRIKSMKNPNDLFGKRACDLRLVEQCHFRQLQNNL